MASSARPGHRSALPISKLCPRTVGHPGRQKTLDLRLLRPRVLTPQLQTFHLGPRLMQLKSHSEAGHTGSGGGVVGGHVVGITRRLRASYPICSGVQFPLSSSACITKISL